MNAHKIIIIPDLHGREFWRGAANDMDVDTQVVFLGDYLDPYEDDWIYWSDAFQGFKDAIAFKEAHPDSFQMAVEYNIAGKRYLFSHAGIHSDWARKHSTLFGPLERVTADTFNQLMFTPEFVDALSEVSWRRGGTATAGSMVWADIYEYGLSAPIAPDVVQICGHTRLLEGKPKELNQVICLDCQRAFTLTEDGINT